MIWEKQKSVYRIISMCSILWNGKYSIYTTDIYIYLLYPEKGKIHVGYKRRVITITKIVCIHFRKIK